MYGDFIRSLEGASFNGQVGEVPLEVGVGLLAHVQMKRIHLCVFMFCFLVFSPVSLVSSRRCV